MSAVAVEGGISRPAAGSVVGTPVEQLFAADYQKLAGWLSRLVGDVETGQEIASEAFVRLLSKWSSLGNLDSPRSYLYTIATNLARDHWRAAERQRRAISKITAAAERELVTDPVADMEVRQLIATLPTRLRDAFLLRYYTGSGIHEIGLLLKRPDGTIKADLHHARSQLKEALEAAR